MKKPFSKRVLVLFFILSSLSLFAQNEEKRLVLIPNIGVNFSNIEKPIAEFLVSEEKTNKAKVGISYTIGANLKIPVLEGVDFLTGLEYVNYKYSFEDFSIIRESNKDVYSIAMDAHSIEAPFILSKDIYASGFKINAGVQLGYVVSTHSEHTVKSYERDNNGFWTFKDEEELREDIKGLVKRTKISIPVGFSFELPRLYFSLLYNFGITKFYDDNYSKNVTFKVGYKI